MDNVLIIGGSRGRAEHMPLPAMGSNSFIFAHICAKKNTRVGGPHPLNGSTPPPYGKFWVRHCLWRKDIPEYDNLLRPMSLETTPSSLWSDNVTTDITLICSHRNRNFLMFSMKHNM